MAEETPGAMPCENCGRLREIQRFRSPRELTAAIRALQANLQDSTLVELPGSTPFSEIQADGPWPDTFEYYFRCADCNRRFRFSAETYHGNGGVWTPLD